MPKYNINTILIGTGFLLLLFGFFMDQKGSLDFQVYDTYLVVGKAQTARTLGILTILNGLVYALFDRLNFFFNRRFKYFGIILFFLSLLIVFIGILIFATSNGLDNSHLISTNNSTFSVLLILAGIFTLFLSLFMPMVIWLNITARKFFSRR